jgi:hypothetical protein
VLNTGFRGLPVTWKCIANGTTDDGRWLYEIETDTIEHQEVILEGLQMWGVHLKTLTSAKELAEKLLGTEVVVDKDKIFVADTNIMET